MPRVSAEELTHAVSRLLVALRTPEDIAARVAAVLVGADLAGHPSHGVARVPSYLEEARAGKVGVAARPRTTRETAATALVDGGNGWGAYAAEHAMGVAIAKAKACGSGLVTIMRCPHIGRLGHYVEAAAREGCIGIAMLGFGGRGLGWSSPFGGRENMLMTNPIALAVPGAGGAPFLLDFATTTASHGKIKLAEAKGEELPDGWVLDAAGRPSNRPEDFHAGGSLTLMGGHKGYALSLATCLLGGLSGAFNPDHARMGGIFLQAISVEAFAPPPQYGRNVDAFLGGMRSSRPADPDRPVLVPGDLEARARERQARDGIDLPGPVWDEIAASFGSLDVALPRLLH